MTENITPEFVEKLLEAEENDNHSCNSVLLTDAEHNLFKHASAIARAYLAKCEELKISQQTVLAHNNGYKSIKIDYDWNDPALAAFYRKNSECCNFVYEDAK